jgi:hypothetical protein
MLSAEVGTDRSFVHDALGTEYAFFFAIVTHLRLSSVLIRQVMTKVAGRRRNHAGTSWQGHGRIYQRSKFECRVTLGRLGKPGSFKYLRQANH